MAHQTLQAPAPNLPLHPGMILRLEAINPSSDAQVAGVVSTRWSIYGYDESDPVDAPEPLLDILVIPVEG